MGRTILSFVAGAASAAAVIYTIGPPPPASWIDSSGPEDAIETEAFDPAWAPATEQQLDRFLQGRLALAGIRCRTTVCEIRVSSDLSPADGPLDTGNGGLLNAIHDQPWGAQFDRSETRVLRSMRNGTPEHVVYLTKKDPGNPVL